MKHKILIAVALMIFTSCMKVKKKDDEAAPVAQAQQLQSEEQPATRKDRTALEYKYEVNPTTEYHKVHFYAPSNWPSGITVTKSNGTVQYQVSAQFDRQGEWVDDLVPGEKVNYKFFAKLDKDQKTLAEVEVLPVLDLQIQDDDVNLVEFYKITAKTKLIQFRHLVINAQKHLYIEDFSGAIMVDHLETDNGFIQTFPLEVRAQDGIPGRNGGQVQLKINEGTGQLIVTMKGQNGGIGLPALPPDASKKGQRGLPTQGATFTMETGTTNSVGDGYGFNLPFTDFKCKTEPGTPSNGQPGEPGFPGNDGQMGGNTGSIRINNQSESLDIDYHAIPGIGGSPSHGGAGGEGGDPGEVADGAMNDARNWLLETNPALAKGFPNTLFRITFSKPCTASILGSRGSQGPQGPPGQSRGADGIIQPSYLNSQKIQNPN